MATHTKKAPTSLTLRTYQVGFGDCYLLTFAYPAGDDRHVLIDFGSNAQPKSAPADLLSEIAADIANECGGKLHAVVLTHRHKDHIQGFTTRADGKGSGDIIASLEPDLVVQPWTEDPDAKPDATAPTNTPATTDGTKGFVAALEHMHDVSAGVSAEALRLARAEPPGRQRGRFLMLHALGEEGVKNKSAVENLRRMGERDGAAAEYVNHGYPTKLNALLPGVRVTVLGPPTLEQSDEIRKERSKDANEFWMFQANAGRFLVGPAAATTEDAMAGATVPTLFGKATVVPAEKTPQYARWFIPRLRAIRAENLLGMVRILDDAMNNTSVILLFEVNGIALLFPGDAQIENWQYTLNQLATDADLKRRLADVSVYKVGHHGSRNATPKTLWANFQRRGKAGTKGRLRTFVSTMAGVYGKSEGSEVPRATLVAALKKDTDFFSTQSIRGKSLKHVAEFDLG